MKCTNCKTILKNEDNFCTNCGIKLKENKKEPLNTISVIIGILGLVLSIFIKEYALLFSIIGLIVALINYMKKGNKALGIILNFLSSFFILGTLDYEVNPISGEFRCKTSSQDKYSVELILSKNGDFLYGPYNDIENNHAKGKYMYENEYKQTKNGKYSYYMVTFEGKNTDFIVDGKPTHDFKNKMEIGITEDKKEAIIIFLNSYNIYYCENKTS